MLNLKAPIIGVTVLEDRAFIRRRGQMEVPAGRHRWQLEGPLSPVVVDKSLAATVEGGGRCLGVHIIRSRARCDSPLPNQAPSSDNQVELELTQQELDSAERMLGELLYMISEQTSPDEGPIGTWERQIVELMDWKEDLLQRKLQLLDSQTGEVPKRPTGRGAFAPRARCAQMMGEVETGESCLLTFTLEYCVALACWRPYHQAEWTDSGVRFSAEGCVWQNTGEDWTEVELVLSTERQSLGAVPPPLPREILNTRKRNGEVILEERQVEIQESPGGSPSDEIPGIDDGGQVFTTPVPCRCTIPSDGLAVRVPLFEFLVPCSLENLLVAELQPQVVAFTSLTNRSPHPILAGPVELLKEGAWVGRARLGMVSPGENFRLGWGSQNSLRARREERQLPEVKDDLLGGWTRSRHEVSLTLSNLSAQTHTVQVVERIPISEIKQVEILPDLKSITPSMQPDADGLLRWTLELTPRSRQTVQSAYWMRKRREVVAGGTP